VKILLEFARARPLTSVGLVHCLVTAGLVEGLGLSTVLPLASVAIEGGASKSPTGLEAWLLGVLHGVGLEPTLGVLLTAITVAFTLKAGLVLLVRRQVGYTVARVVTDLRLRLLRALLRADWRFYVRRPIGGFTNSFIAEANRSGTAYMHATWVAFRGLQVVVYAAIAFATAWKVTAVALVLGAALAWSLGRLVQSGRRAGRRQTKLYRELVSRFTDLLQGVKPLKAMGRAESVTPFLEKDTLRLQKARLKQVYVKEALAAVQEPIVIAILCAGLFLGATVGGMELPRLALLAIVLERTYSAMNKGQQRYQKVAIDESAYWALRRAIGEAEAQAERSGTGPVAALRSGVELDGVDLRHGDQTVLTGATLAIPAGEVTALTGPSGSGKTTIVDLVVGLLPPDAGEVRIDGVPLPELDLEAWRRALGYVPQDTFLLHDTIGMNVSLGDPAIGPAETERALREAHAWEFIEALPDGLDTVVGERGSALSGGQRQRIAIARALVHRPSLLILDEATTALDPASEQAVLAAVRELRGHTTVLAISHQPALLAVADRVYHVEGGRVRPRPVRAPAPSAAAGGRA
jgi:ATP-binding cassette subfamily C protein